MLVELSDVELRDLALGAQLLRVRRQRTGEVEGCLSVAELRALTLRLRLMDSGRGSEC